MAADGYLERVLADATRPFVHRGRVARLLGLPPGPAAGPGAGLVLTPPAPLPQPGFPRLARSPLARIEPPDDLVALPAAPTDVHDVGLPGRDAGSQADPAAAARPPQRVAGAELRIPGRTPPQGPRAAGNFGLSGAGGPATSGPDLSEPGGDGGSVPVAPAGPARRVPVARGLGEQAQQEGQGERDQGEQGVGATSEAPAPIGGPVGTSTSPAGSDAGSEGRERPRTARRAAGGQPAAVGSSTAPRTAGRDGPATRAWPETSAPPALDGGRGVLASRSPAAGSPAREGVTPSAAPVGRPSVAPGGADPARPSLPAAGRAAGGTARTLWAELAARTAGSRLDVADAPVLPRGTPGRRRTGRPRTAATDGTTPDDAAPSVVRPAPQAGPPAPPQASTHAAAHEAPQAVTVVVPVAATAPAGAAVPAAFWERRYLSRLRAGLSR